MTWRQRFCPNVLDDIILLVSLPSIEEYPDDREATEADLHLAAGYLMDLDDTDQRLCKYLLFYSQIIVDLSSFERTEILENISGEIPVSSELLKSSSVKTSLFVCN